MNIFVAVTKMLREDIKPGWKSIQNKHCCQDGLLYLTHLAVCARHDTKMARVVFNYQYWSENLIYAASGLAATGIGSLIQNACLMIQRKLQ